MTDDRVQKKMSRMGKNNEKSKGKGNKTDLTSMKSELESTNSTLEKMQDFLNDHGLASSLSTTDSLNPLQGTSFQADYKEMEKKRLKDNLNDPMKKALESRRSEFEEIRQHLEQRSLELKKRIKKIGVINKTQKKDEKSHNLSYHSTEFSPDLDSNTASFKQSELLSNKERLRLLTNKHLVQIEEKKHSKDRKPLKDDCQFSTHAIFAHLARLKNVSDSRINDSDPNLSMIGNRTSTTARSQASSGSLKSITSIKSNKDL